MNTVKLQPLENAMFIKVGFQFWPPADKKHFTNDRQISLIMSSRARQEVKSITGTSVRTTTRASNCLKLASRRTIPLAAPKL